MRRLTSVLGASLVLAGCGGGGDKPNGAASTPPAGKPDTSAVRAAQQYVDAYSAKKPKVICGLLASSVRAQLNQKPKTCVKTVGISLKGDIPKFEADKAYRTGDTARVTFKGSPRQVMLVLEKGQWKVINGGT